MPHIIVTEEDKMLRSFQYRTLLRKYGTALVDESGTLAPFIYGPFYRYFVFKPVASEHVRRAIGSNPNEMCVEAINKPC